MSHRSLGWIRSLAVGSHLGVCGLAGCPKEPMPPPEPCMRSEDPLLALANRDGTDEFVIGSEVDVFLPPQGGVFTELDVTIDNMGASELDELQVSVQIADGGEPLAQVYYIGERLPLRCTAQEELTVDNLPVGFDEGRSLDELDGLPAILTGTLQTTRGSFEVRYAVTLRRVDY